MCMQAREELQTKEQELRQKSGELQAIASEKDQTIAMLQDELDIGVLGCYRSCICSSCLMCLCLHGGEGTSMVR